MPARCTAHAWSSAVRRNFPATSACRRLRCAPGSRDAKIPLKWCSWPQWRSCCCTSTATAAPTSRAIPVGADPIPNVRRAAIVRFTGLRNDAPVTAISVYSRALLKAAELLGGRNELAQVLQVPAAQIEKWIADETKPPREIFLRVVDIIL